MEFKKLLNLISEKSDYEDAKYYEQIAKDLIDYFIYEIKGLDFGDSPRFTHYSSEHNIILNIKDYHPKYGTEILAEYSYPNIITIYNKPIVDKMNMLTLVSGPKWEENISSILEEFKKIRNTNNMIMDSIIHELTHHFDYDAQGPNTILKKQNQDKDIIRKQPKDKQSEVADRIYIQSPEERYAHLMGFLLSTLRENHSTFKDALVSFYKKIGKRFWNTLKEKHKKKIINRLYRAYYDYNKDKKL